MTIQEIEKAVSKQLPGRKENLLLSNFITKDSLHDAGMVIICGFASIYLNDPEKTVIRYYDINAREYSNKVRIFFKHMKRVVEIVESYGAKAKGPGFYKEFDHVFWDTHNPNPNGEEYKSGIILSHVLSSKREFRNFVKNNKSHFEEGDYTSFFIYNKVRLTKNYLFFQKPVEKEYVDFLGFAY